MSNINSNDVIFTQRNSDNTAFKNVVVPAVTSSLFHLDGENNIKTSPIDNFILENVSIVVYTASLAMTASRVESSNVIGTVASSSFAQNAVTISASLSDYITQVSQSINYPSEIFTGSSYPITSSWSNTSSLAKSLQDGIVINPSVVNASLFNGNLNGTSSTSSYWNSSSLVSLVNTKQNQLITGSTYPITSSVSNSSLFVTASNVSGTVNSASHARVADSTRAVEVSTIFVNTISFLDTPDIKITPETPDNYVAVDQGQFRILNPVGSSVFKADMDGNLFLSGSITASNYPPTLVNSASVATTASYWNSSSLVSLVNTKQNQLTTGSTYPITCSFALTTSIANANHADSSATLDIVSSLDEGSVLYVYQGNSINGNGQFIYDEINNSLKIGSTNSIGFAGGRNNFVQGESNTISGTGSNIGGNACIVSSDFSHAEGISNTVTGYGSHAEGASNQNGGTFSHVEGYSNNIVSSIYSHLEGNNCTMDGNYNHVSGHYINSTGNVCRVFGSSIYNDSKYSTIIGQSITSSCIAGTIVGHSYLDNPIDNRLRSVTSSLSLYYFWDPIYTYRTYYHYEPDSSSAGPIVNPHFWGRDLNFTFVSGYFGGTIGFATSYGTYMCTSKTPITNKHVVWASHCGISSPYPTTGSYNPGEYVLYYAKKDGTIVSSSLVKYTTVLEYNSDLSDLSVGLLDPPLPSDITPCKLMPSGSFLTNDVLNIISNKNFPHLRSSKWHRRIVLYNGILYNNDVYPDAPTKNEAMRDGTYIGIEGGDSSGPQFFFTDNIDEPILWGLHGGTARGKLLRNLSTEINECLEVLSPGEGYTVVTASLTTSSFSTYNLQPINVSVGKSEAITLSNKYVDIMGSTTINGSVQMNIKTISSSYSLSDNDYTILCNNVGSIIVTLPKNLTFHKVDGRVYKIKSINTGQVTITGSVLGSTIDSSGSRIINTLNETVTVQGYNDNWWII
jgi:hypothetical protein